MHWHQRWFQEPCPVCKISSIFLFISLTTMKNQDIIFQTIESFFNNVTERLDTHTGKFACAEKFTGVGGLFMLINIDSIFG